MKVHILDDWFDTLKTLPSFDRLGGHDVTIWTDHTEDLDVLADRLAEAEALVLFRERTPITAALLERLPGLKLISQRSVYPHVDVPACTANTVLLSSNMHSDTPSVAASELTFALILASARQIPQQMASLRAGQWQMGVGQTLAGRRLGLYGYGRIGKQVAGYARAFGMKVWWWGSDEGRARAEAHQVPVQVGQPGRIERRRQPLGDQPALRRNGFAQQFVAGPVGIQKLLVDDGRRGQHHRRDDRETQPERAEDTQDQPSPASRQR